jgi:hypothetical protein
MSAFGWYTIYMLNRSLIVLPFALFLVSALPAEAHVFKYFETVSVLLHMEPGDDPFAGEPGQLFFYFNDSANKFQVSQCQCRVKISEGDKVLYDEPLTGEAKAYGEQVRLVNFTFPRRDIYKVDLTVKEKDYAPFALSWDVRIDRESEHPVPVPEESNVPWAWVGVAGGAIIIGMMAGYLLRRPVQR